MLMALFACAAAPAPPAEAAPPRASLVPTFPEAASASAAPNEPAGGQSVEAPHNLPTPESAPSYATGGKAPPSASGSSPAIDPYAKLPPLPVVTTARIAVTGDLMVHETQLNHAYNSSDKTYSFASCFEPVAPYLKDADYTVGNLETTLSGPESKYTGYPAFNTPDSFAEALKEAGFDFVTTANNHANDRREAGILRTISVLDSLGFDHTGTYASQEEQEATFIKTINGIRFAFLSYSYSTNGIPLANGKPYLLNMLDEALMKRQIEKARQIGADIIIVLPHMGNEYEEKPTAYFTGLARRLCDYGADVIMASHPHVLQPAESYEVTEPDGSVRTCFIAYSMGNFISAQRAKPRDAGAIFYLEFEKIEDETSAAVRITRVSYAPTWVQFYDAQGRYDIKVLPVYDALKAAEEGTSPAPRQADLPRLREVHRETSKKLLGAEWPLADILPVYTLYSEKGS